MKQNPKQDQCNPTFKDKYSVSYMWEDILKKDTVLDLISKFIFIEIKESKDELTGKTKKSENIIFPRYHQLDVIRKLLADVRENGSNNIRQMAEILIA